MNVHLLAQMKTLSVLKMDTIFAYSSDKSQTKHVSGKSLANCWSELLNWSESLLRIAGANVIWCDIANIANVIWCDINKISVCHAQYKTISLQTQAGVEMKYRLAIQDLFRVVV